VAAAAHPVQHGSPHALAHQRHAEVADHQPVGDLAGHSPRQAVRGGRPGRRGDLIQDDVDLHSRNVATDRGLPGRWRSWISSRSGELLPVTALLMSPGYILGRGTVTGTGPRCPNSTISSLGPSCGSPGHSRHRDTASTALASKTPAGLDLTTLISPGIPCSSTVNCTTTCPVRPARLAFRGYSGPGRESNAGDPSGSTSSQSLGALHGCTPPAQPLTRNPPSINVFTTWRSLQGMRCSLGQIAKSTTSSRAGSRHRLQWPAGQAQRAGRISLMPQASSSRSNDQRGWIRSRSARSALLAKS
jgi:hypothetical protein